jgi:WD40 repeat protein
VWLARDTRLERLVALKLLTELAALSPQALERFHREAQVASRLDDPGLCTIYETGSEHGVHFIAMRYVEGSSLATLLDEVRARAAAKLASFPALPADPDEEGAERPPEAAALPRNASESVRRTVRLFERLARSLHRAHEAGIVHRDLKPGNVMVTPSGQPVLLDFGLAGVLDETLPSVTRTGDVFGTPAYMAPEQLAGKAGDGARVDRRTDVYALGATLYECLTLRHPFESVTREALYQAIREQDPADPRRTNPAIPVDLWTILQTCLAKDRERRYRTALELAEDLRRFREGKPVHAHPPSRIYRARRFVRRYRALVTATLVVIGTLVVATIVSTAGFFRARRAEERAMRSAESESRLRRAAQDSAAEASAEKKRAEERGRAARQAAYAAEMQLAFRARDERNLGRMLQLLEAQVPARGQEDLRGFEWYCLWKLCRPGRLATFRDSEGAPVVALAVAADGASFLTLDAGGRALRRRVDDGAVLGESQATGFVLGVTADFSADGRRLAFLGGKPLEAPALEVWATEDWQRILSFGLPEASCVTLSGDGARLAWVEADERLVVVDVGSGTRLLDRRLGLSVAHEAAFHPGAGRVAVAGASRDSGRVAVIVIDVATGAETRREEWEDLAEIKVLDFAPRGEVLAVGGTSWFVRVLAVDALRDWAVLEGHQGGNLGLAFSPDGRMLATNGAADSTLRFWDVAQGKEAFPLRARELLEQLMAFTPDGERLLTAGGGTNVALWSVRAEPLPLTVAAPLDLPHDYIQLSFLAFSPDSRTLALNERSGALALFDVESRSTRATLEAGERVRCALFAPDGRTLFLGTEDGDVAAYDPDTAVLRARVRAHEGQVHDLALAPDGKSLASTGKDGKVALWDAATLAGRGSHRSHAGAVQALLFASDGATLWSSGEDQTLRHWRPDGAGEPESRSLAMAFEFLRRPGSHENAVVHYDWIPTLRTPDFADVHMRFEGHAGGTYRALAFSPDGRTLATGSVDKTVKLWQVETGREVATLPHGNHVHAVAFSPDGRWLAAWSCDGVVKLWPAATPDEVGRQPRERETLPLGTSDGTLDLASPWQASGGQARAAFGFPVAAAGDVDGDGFDDFLVGASSWDGAHADEGKVLLFRGSAHGPAEAPAWSALGAWTESGFGTSLASAGDVNGDGYDDVIIGAHGFDGCGPNCGRAALYSGSAQGLASAPSWQVEGDQAEAMYGQAVASAGDVNGDGHDDVIVGAHGSDGERIESGRAFLYLGSSRGLASTPAWTVRGLQSSAHLGQAIAGVGDVNGDGYDDVLVGAYGYSTTFPGEGLAALYLGSPAGLSKDPAWGSTGRQGSAWFGYSVAGAGDVNADGLSDVLVGAHGTNASFENEGRTHLFLGSRSGALQESDWSPCGGQAYAFLGVALSGAGDVNGDGFADALVGANGFDLGLTDSGLAALFLGSPTGLAATPVWVASGDQSSLGFANSLSAAGDVNGDGFGDLLVGDHLHDRNEPMGGGRAWLYYGRAAEVTRPNPSTEASAR